MSRKQLRVQACSEWNSSADVRRRYPTFVHYWREKYQRVYRIEYRFIGVVLFCR